MTEDYSVITFATNKFSYVTFALNMAQSVLLHNRIKIYIISNLNFEVPTYLKNSVSVIKANETHAALGVGMKLYTDTYLQTEHTLYIDADCLCYAGLASIFEACKYMDVSVAGRVVNAMDWVGAAQAETIKKNFNINQLIRFNGGMYYLKKNENTNRIYDTARDIIPAYDSLGFQRLNGGMLNEEGLISIAMVKNSQRPIPDNGHYITDLYTDTHPRNLNVLKGNNILRNPKHGKHRHRSWYPEIQYSPVIIHFGGSNLKSYTYYSQAVLLKLNAKQINNSTATAIVNLFIHVPFKVARWLIGLLKK